MSKKIVGGLHEFLDQMQLKMNDVGEEMAITFFGLQPVSATSSLNIQYATQTMN